MIIDPKNIVCEDVNPEVIADARQLALEKWMEAVTNLLNNPHPSHSDMRFIDDCLEEYKRVSKS